MENKKYRRIKFDEMPNLVGVLTVKIEEMSETLTMLKEELEDLRESVMAKPITSKKIPVSIDRACEIIGKSKHTIYRYTSHGLIPHYKQGKTIYFFEDELLEWIRKCRLEQLIDIPENRDRQIIQISAKSKRD